jgi:ribosomal protein S27AE
MDVCPNEPDPVVGDPGVSDAGEPVCLLSRVCPDCGRLAEEPDVTACPTCGANLWR